MEKIRGLSEDHEVLTPDNYWVKIKDLDSNSRIAQWDHITSEISFVKPDEIYEWDYRFSERESPLLCDSTPIRDGMIVRSNTIKLWKNIEEHPRPFR